MSKLLPCPFCGGKAELLSNGIGDFFARCEGCFARTCDANCESESHAASRWNIRNGTPALKQIAQEHNALEADNRRLTEQVQLLVAEREHIPEAIALLEWIHKTDTEALASVRALDPGYVPDPVIPEIIARTAKVIAALKGTPQCG